MKVSGLNMNFKKSIDNILEEIQVKNILNNMVSISDNEIKIKNQNFKLDEYRKIFIFGVGIASMEIAEFFCDLLKEKVFRGLVLVPPGFARSLKKIEVREVTSPLVDEKSYKAARDLVYMLENLNKNDLAIIFFSRGAEEALDLLEPEVDPEEYHQLLTRAKNAGLNGRETDIVLKHTLALKGGKLLNHTHPARSISLIFSDEPGGDSAATFSGPTVPDSSTFEDCRNILIKYKLPMKIPSALLNFFNQGLRGKTGETLKPESPQLSRNTNFIMSDSNQLAGVIRKELEDSGYKTDIISSYLMGNSLEIAGFLTGIARTLHRIPSPGHNRKAFVFTGRIEDEHQAFRPELLARVAMKVSQGIEGLEGIKFVTATSFQFEPDDISGFAVDHKSFENLNRQLSEEEMPHDNPCLVSAFKQSELCFRNRLNLNDCSDIFIILSDF